ncbi:cysteine-rich receptor-like protein kinase 32 [Dorcoceras hygrometricum]|uniref:Cysteine-rich receptor-like protein kinase 32 n=1 Tax=Dorcoceras hygrometricum TaxID=472368 RepID=A0A2Z7AF62_9LAMI|nr:cysteine-rich receptor-like protein kinase 32 [Dorcoceras hygrometricum]
MEPEDFEKEVFTKDVKGSKVYFKIYGKDNRRSIFISVISAVGVFERDQQIVCDQQMNCLRNSADRFLESNQQRLDKSKRQRIDWNRRFSRCFLQSISADRLFFDSLFISADGYSKLQSADDVNQQVGAGATAEERTAGEM